MAMISRLPIPADKPAARDKLMTPCAPRPAQMPRLSGFGPILHEVSNQ
jgi:hypothetical protein